MLQRSRILATATLLTILLLFVGLEVRMIYLQLIDPAGLGPKLERFHLKSEVTKGYRGTIYDTRGEVLACSLPAVDVWAWTPDLDNPWTKKKDESQESFRLLEPLLEMDLAQLEEKIAAGGYRRLKKDIADPEILRELYRLKNRRLLRGIELQKKYIRCYPNHDLLGHTLGFVDAEGAGACGVEALLDVFLQGAPGGKTTRRDGIQNELYSPDLPSRASEPGGRLYLTIDSTIQLHAEVELARIDMLFHPQWAAAVVMEPGSGKILAAAGIPALDPSDPTRGEEDRWLNRVFNATYTPGSAFKPLVMAMAFDRGVLGRDEPIDCEGGTHFFGRRRVTDTHVDYRILDPCGILVKSSNIGMSKIALRLVSENAGKGSEEFLPILGYLELLGFGVPSGVLPAGHEASGTVTPLKDWTSQYTLISLSFGNEIAVTPIQMAAGFSVLANGGVYAPPRLIDRMGTPNGGAVTFPENPKRRVFSEETSRIIREMLVRVVDEGTGKAARIPNVQVAGKTGTAEKLPARVEVTSSFVAFAPAENPELLVLIVVDEPKGEHYASKVAASHVKAVLERGLSHLSRCREEERILAGGRGVENDKL